MRNEFPRAVKVAAWDRAGGRCECLVDYNPKPDKIDGPPYLKCGKKLFPGDIFYDHIIADGLGGKPTLDNCQVLCKAHHDAKTFTADVPKIAKTKRVRANHIGAAKPKRGGFSNPNIKKKISGAVVDRATGSPIGWRK